MTDLAQIPAALSNEGIPGAAPDQKLAMGSAWVEEAGRRKRWMTVTTNESTGIIRSVLSLPGGT